MIDCAMCIHDKPCCVTCKAGIHRNPSVDGVNKRIYCEFYDDIREHCDFSGGAELGL